VGAHRATDYDLLQITFYGLGTGLPEEHFSGGGQLMEPVGKDASVYLWIMLSAAMIAVAAAGGLLN
jgi:hypothetical protein